MSAFRAAAIVTGADTVTAAIGSVQSLRRALPPWCAIVLGYSAAPACVTARVREAAGDRPLTIVSSESWVPQHAMRNRALAAAPPADFYLVLDLDSRIEPGTLERCIETHRRLGADLVGGVILYGASIDFGVRGRKIIHYAGGETRARPDADGRAGLEEHHDWVAKPLDEMRAARGTEPWICDQLEFHGMCLTRRAVEMLTPFDELLLVFEPSDLAFTVRKLGLNSVMDPMVEVTYESACEFLCDIAPYREQWGSAAVQASVRYFAQKYGLPDDGELVVHQSGWNRRHFEDVGVVTRLEFPAPALADLHGHSFAQTWPQLVRQLCAQRWSGAEIANVKRCHGVGRALANGVYHRSGKPLIAHLIGTASILAAYGAPPLMVESALAHTAYEQPALAAEARHGGSSALIQRVGLNVDRVLRNFAGQDFGATAAPETEESRAFYPVSAAQALLLRVAKFIDDRLDGAAGLSGKPEDGAVLLAHARAVLPMLGFGALLDAFERAAALDAGSAALPDALLEPHSQSYRLASFAVADAIALPDDKWMEVAAFLRREARQDDVIAAPDEFRYLCPALEGETLGEDGWNRAAAKAIVVLHKGRLEGHATTALAAATAATPIFANEVFVLFSRIGRPVTTRERIHIAAVQRIVSAIALAQPPAAAAPATA
jgi:hypothetical protein